MAKFNFCTLLLHVKSHDIILLYTSWRVHPVGKLHIKFRRNAVNLGGCCETTSAFSGSDLSFPHSAHLNEIRNEHVVLFARTINYLFSSFAQKSSLKFECDYKKYVCILVK